MRFIQRIMPMQRLTLARLIRFSQDRQHRDTIQQLRRVRINIRRLQEGRIKIVIHHRLLGNAPGRYLAIGPTHNQRHANATLIELTLATAQRRIRGHVCLAAIVAAENKNRVPINPQFTQLAVNHSDTIINALQHRRQMWIVMTRPMITRITLHAGILTKIAPFSIARTRPRRVLT